MDTNNLCPYCGRPIIKQNVPFMGEIVLKCPCQVEKERNFDRICEDKTTEISSQIMIKRLLASPDVGPRYFDKTFDNFNLTEKNKIAYNSCQRFVKSFDQYLKIGHGIVLVGGYGCGKTHLEVASAKALIAKGYSVNFYKITTLYNDYKNSFSWKSNEDANNFVLKVNYADLLILDDLVGIDSVGSISSFEPFLYQLIDQRYVQKKPVMISTNIPVIKLKQKLSERIYDRLAGMTTNIVNEEASYRQVEKTESYPKRA